MKYLYYHEGLLMLVYLWACDNGGETCELACRTGECAAVGVPSKTPRPRSDRTEATAAQFQACVGMDREW